MTDERRLPTRLGLTVISFRGLLLVVEKNVLRQAESGELPSREVRADPSGHSLAVTDVGAGPIVVFAHGTPTWSFEWRHLIHELARDHRCIAPDHLGFGRSPRPRDADYSPEAHARRFAALLTALSVERYTLVAHDFGGPIALDGALENPERLDRVVLINTFAFPFGDSRRGATLAWLAGTPLWRWLYRQFNFSFVISRSAWGKGPRPKDVWRRYAAIFPDADSRERVLWSLARSMAASAPFFGSIWQRRGRLATTPVQIIWGLADSALTPDMLGRLTSAWPHAEVVRLPAVGHWPHEEAPQETAEAVRRFLSAPDSPR